MVVNKNLVTQVFYAYTGNYDLTDPKVKLKIDHTLRVAGICEHLACVLSLNAKEKDFAWLLGMLHDVGRFEQLRRFKTFIDEESIDHASLGADILFKEGLIHQFGLEELGEEEIDGLDKVIRSHSAYRLSKELSLKELMFANILRDSDKIDILKVNCIVPPEEIYGVSKEELHQSRISEAVMDSFQKQTATLRTLKKTPMDHLAGHISLVYELVYDESCQLVVDQGYLSKILAFPSLNQVTLEQLQEIKKKINRYLQERLHSSFQLIL